MHFLATLTNLAMASRCNRILENVFSDAIGKDVCISSAECQNSITIDQLFASGYSCIYTRNCQLECEFSISVVFPDRKTLSLSVSPFNRIEHIKNKIERQEKISARRIRLIMSGTELSDDSTCQSVDMKPGAILWGLYNSTNVPQQLKLLQTDLAPNYDYDFTTVVDDGIQYVRGGYKYNRPYGWYRYGLNVSQYADSTWLGPDGIRNESAPGEWAVGYHGTKRCSQPDCDKKIVDEGLIIGPGCAYGCGIYTSPSLEMIANYYANTVQCDGKTYKYAFQTRVDPTRLKVITKAKDGADYWLSPNDAVRPYGIVVKEVEEKNCFLS